MSEFSETQSNASAKSHKAVEDPSLLSNSFTTILTQL